MSSYALRRICRALLLSVLALLPHLVCAASAPTRPNILLIMADDMGFSDVGAFGGEIATPHLDQLATDGLRMTNFHVAATCSPTRAMLLTGVDHHRAGIANMKELITPSQRGQPGYLGHLDPGVPTIAERLRKAGYHTIMSGKWHLGVDAEFDPANRGFEEVFTLLDGGHNHFGKPNLPPPELGGVHYTENGEPVSIPDDFYSSDYFTDKLLGYLARPTDKPFFAYLPFSAPHWPLHAPKENIAHYKGRYDAGWDALRRERLQRQQSLGILGDDIDMAPPATLRQWESFSKKEQQEFARKMEIYAAMVERMDWNIGRVIDELRSTGQLDNTVVIFLSDNGAAPDTLSSFANKVPHFPSINAGQPEDWGGADSMLSYGTNWAQASTAPYRLYKSVVTEGGLVSPLIVRYPGFARQASIDKRFATVLDMVPTLLSIAGVRQPETPEAFSGRSMLPFLMRETETIHQPDELFGWELFGQRAMRQGDWKLVYVSKPNGTGDWALYDLASDPYETEDVSAAHPGVFEVLQQGWQEYQRTMGIILEEQVVSPWTAL
ncbi:arylsulfatase [Parahaliea mediterranea]|uniref:arylsulfatase n=1 Tax=Parahaliea mediterranea TaxID=651086 RepID=UPI000E2FB7C7|nr:arylsulfatase [Parahaliea mediterranea]